MIYKNLAQQLHHACVGYEGVNLVPSQTSSVAYDPGKPDHNVEDLCSHVALDIPFPLPTLHHVDKLLRIPLHFEKISVEFTVG